MILNGDNSDSFEQKRLMFSCRSLFLFVLCYWRSLRCCVFLQVYKLALLFPESIMSRVGYLFSQNQYITEDLEFRKAFPLNRSSEVKIKNIKLGERCNTHYVWKPLGLLIIHFLLAVRLCIWLGTIIFIVMLLLLGHLDKIKKLYYWEMNDDSFKFTFANQCLGPDAWRRVYIELIGCFV